MEIGQELNTKFGSSNQKALINLRHTANFVSQKYNSYMAHYDLSMPQFNILRILRGAKGAINVNTVKERMIERSPNTTRLMDKLIEKGLMERIRCESDRRVVYVSITDAGQELLSKIDSDFTTYQDLMNKLTEQEAEVLSELLDKIRD